MKKKYKTLWKEMPTKWKKIFLLNSYYFEKLISEKEFRQQIYFFAKENLEKEKYYERLLEESVEEDLKTLLKMEEFDFHNVSKLLGDQFHLPELLFELPNLKSLRLNLNPGLDFSVLKKLPNLEKLYLAGNLISNISFLQNLTKLEVLNLVWNGISNISYLKKLSNLKDLDLTMNEISDISPLQNLTNLEKLDLRGNQISDLSPLLNLKKLKKLTLSKNTISDTSILKKFPKSVRIDL